MKISNRVLTRISKGNVSSGQNLTEKIVQRYAIDLQPGELVKSGSFVTIRPYRVLTHDNTAAVLQKFSSWFRIARVFDPLQPVFAMDHDIQNKTEKNLKKYNDIMEFARLNSVDFYPPATGIGHQIMIEQGYAFPSTLTVASDSHSNMYGGIGCLGTPIVRTDAASIWASGETWWQVPPVVKVNLHGTLGAGVTGKDVIVALCGLFNNDQVLNTAIEFHGDAIRNLSIDERLSIANMTTEWGALSGLFPVDAVTIDWLKQRQRYFEKIISKEKKFPCSDTVPSLSSANVHPRINSSTIQNLINEPVVADDNAVYAKTLHLDLSSLVDSFVSGPNSVKIVSPLSELEKKKIKIQKGYLVSCVNSRESDIHAAAEVFRNHAARNDKMVRVHDEVEFYVAAASAEVEKNVRESGDWQILLDAGAKPLPPGCGPCIGLGAGLLKDGEVGISATNRNFKGRMGSRDALAYLSSPSVVASSVIKGYICGDETQREKESLKPNYWIDDTSSSNDQISTPRVSMLDEFPSKITGEILFCPVDNLNTDGIYPGKYTYRDDLSPLEMAKVCMENYDPNFTSLVQLGDILAVGTNFGSGSSREQAATCLKYAGIKIVFAASFSETYKRNAFNNGLICLESDKLYKYLRNSGSHEEKTIRTGLNAHIDFVNSILKVVSNEGTVVHECGIPRLGRIAQKLIVHGGLEELVKKTVNSNV